MKNIFTCVLSIVLFCALGANSVWGATATFAPSDFSGQGTSGTGSAISATVDGITFACDLGYGGAQIRCYQYGTITISSVSKTITGISFTFTDGRTGGLSTSYTGLSTDSWSRDLTSQARISQCIVTYSTGGGSSYTVTLSKNGTTTDIADLTGTYTLPTTGEHVANACEGWAWHCWANAAYSTGSPTSTAPSSTVITSMTSAGTAYAVYKHTETSGGGSTSTFVSADQGWSDGGNAATKNIESVTYSFAQNSGTTPPRYYDSGTSVRFYQNNSLTISSSSTITAIEFTYTQSAFAQASVSTGTVTDGNWSGSATSVTFTNKNSTQVRISQIVVTIGGGSTTTYTSLPDCTPCYNKVTLTKGEESHGTFTLNKSNGEYNNCASNFVVTVSGITPESGYYCTGVTATGEHCSVTGPDGSGNYTVTYEMGNAVTSTITANFAPNPTYTVTWSMNGDESNTDSYEEGASIVFPGTAAGCDGKVFRGWSAAPVTETDVEPSYVTSATMPAHAVTYYAVYATLIPGSGTTATYEFAITSSDFSGSGYDSNNGAHTSTATDTSNPSNTMTVTWVSNNVSSSSGTQWRKSNGYIYNSTDLGKINSVTLSGDALSIYYGTSEEPTGTSLGTNDGFFKVANETGGALHTTSVTVNFTKSSGTSDTYSDYSSVCGTCLPAPTSPIVTPKSNRATITWTAVPDATGYTVICTGGTVNVDGTTATITGLASETSYDFTIRSQGSDPYSCFPAYHGSFTTTACEDSPILGATSVTPTTAELSWTCEAATTTIRVYEDAECNTQFGADHTFCTSPYTINSLMSNTTYYYKIWSGATCVSAVGSFTTEEIKLDIAEWQPDAVVVSYNGDADLTLTTFTEETHGDPHANVAEDIFFSKYFEAAANVKLLAIFNGTLNTVDLSNYKLGLAQAGEGTSVTQNFAFKKFSEFVKASGGGLTADELELKSNEELILITYTDVETDEAIIKCARDDEEHSKFSTYVRLSTPNLQFNGDDVISLLNPEGDMIDLIGAGTKDGGLDRTGASFIHRSSGVDYNGFMDRPGGWYTTSGYQANNDNTETSGYALSSNRCLLIRRKFVKSGHIAVELNESDFVTLGAHTYMGNPREGEWKGVQIPGSTTEGTKPGLSKSCDGFEVVGSYDYNDYYVDFEISGTPTTFDDMKSNPFDGTYVIPVANLNEKACTQVRIELKDGSDNLVIRKDVKVPIMISGNKETTDGIFHSNYKDADICRECDVVILSNASLTKVADGTADDIVRVRDVKVYPNGRLIVPSGTHYNVNSLAFRRQEDEVASANIQGTLNVEATNGTYLDLRIDPTNWHFITLPYDVNVNDITFSTGDPAVLGADYLLQWYDGARRAATKNDDAWEPVTPGSVLKAGLGYICALPGDGIIKRELRFPMANDVITQESTNKTVSPVYGYGCDQPSLGSNHKGWNLIGSPYLMPYTSDLESPLRTGLIIEDHSSDPWDGSWTDNGDGIYYIAVPINNGWDYYEQVTMADYSMPPFTSYFVQIGGSNPTAEQEVEFSAASVPRSIVSRNRLEAEEVEDSYPVWCQIDLTNPQGETDKTTVLISNKFTDDYDMMRDMVKMRGSYYSYYTRPVLASRNNEGEMAFNALPDASALSGIPLSFFAAGGGSYTFSFNERYGREEVKEVKLLDKNNGQWHDLLTEPYSFTTNRVDDKNRFVLSVRVERKKPQTPTGVEQIGNEQGDVEGCRKILMDGHIYILRGAQLYDVTGKQVSNRK